MFPEIEQLDWEPLGLTDFCLLQEGLTLISEAKQIQDENNQMIIDN